ncbi:hypothetical protein ACT7DI_25250 [Bacillus paranthracis]
MFFLFYKLDQVDKEYEERAKKREVEMAARRVELKKKKEESLAELLKKTRRNESMENTEIKELNPPGFKCSQIRGKNTAVMYGVQTVFKISINIISKRSDFK